MILWVVSPAPPLLGDSISSFPIPCSAIFRTPRAPVFFAGYVGRVSCAPGCGRRRRSVGFVVHHPTVQAIAISPPLSRDACPSLSPPPPTRPHVPARPGPAGSHSNEGNAKPRTGRNDAGSNRRVPAPGSERKGMAKGRKRGKTRQRSGEER